MKQVKLIKLIITNNLLYTTQNFTKIQKENAEAILSRRNLKQHNNVRLKKSVISVRLIFFKFS